MARQQARRQHRERVAGIALAVLGAIVLIVALFALRQPSGRNAADSATAVATVTTGAATPSARASTSLPRSEATRSGPSLNLDSSGAPSVGAVKSVPLVVLNNSTITGLAVQAAARFRSGGWKVADTGNLQNNIISTCAYYDPSMGSAKSAAEALQQQYPTIKRVQPKFAELPPGPVVVVLTSDYSSG